jgi:hypothetical protein
MHRDEGDHMRAIIIRGYGGPDVLELAVSRFKAGDTVIGMRDLLTAPAGAQAEQVVLDTDAVAPAPRSVGPVEAHQRVADGGLRGRIVLTLNA